MSYSHTYLGPFTRFTNNPVEVQRPVEGCPRCRFGSFTHAYCPRCGTQREQYMVKSTQHVWQLDDDDGSLIGTMMENNVQVMVPNLGVFSITKVFGRNLWCRHVAMASFAISVHQETMIEEVEMLKRAYAEQIDILRKKFSDDLTIEWGLIRW